MKKLKKVQLKHTKGEVHVNSQVISSAGSMFVDGSSDELNKFYQGLKSRGIEFISKEKAYLKSNLYGREQRVARILHDSSFAINYVSLFGDFEADVYFGEALSRPKSNPFTIRTRGDRGRRGFNTDKVGIYILRNKKLNQDQLDWINKRDIRGFYDKTYVTFEPLVEFRRMPTEWYPEIEEAVKISKSVIMKR